MAAPCFDSDYARIYDLIYAGKGYGREVEICISKAGLADSGGHILDYGCGTGNHASVWLDRGFRVTGLDINDSMLDIARKKELGPQAEFLHSSKIDQLESQSLDAVCMLFDVLSYLPSSEAVQELMDHFHRLLKPDGRFIFDFWYEPAVLHLKPEVRTAHFQDEFTRVRRTATPTHFSNEKSIVVNYEIIVSSDERELKFEETHRMRYFSQAEVADFLNTSGFKCVKFFTWEEPEREPNQEDWSIVCFARKDERP